MSMIEPRTADPPARDGGAGMPGCCGDLAVRDAMRQAADARIAAFVTFYWRPGREQFLDRVLRNLAEFAVRRMHVTVATNLRDCSAVERLCQAYFGDDCAVNAYPDCDPPFMLTWMHKPALRRSALDRPLEFSHFIYLEDDIGLTFRNFLYFLGYVPALRERGLLPGLLRTEFNHRECAHFSTDAMHATPVQAQTTVRLPDATFIPPQFPYQACFIMDRAMINEYLASRSFEYERSIEVQGAWDIATRSAMGLCFESPPAGFAHRYVLPVDANLRPLPMCWIDHMPANYTNATPPGCFGQIPVARLFVAG